VSTAPPETHDSLSVAPPPLPDLSTIDRPKTDWAAIWYRTGMVAFSVFWVNQLGFIAIYRTTNLLQNPHSFLTWILFPVCYACQIVAELAALIAVVGCLRFIRVQRNRNLLLVILVSAGIDIYLTNSGFFALN
jgi:magnesium-transporting ATPase (P-type)